jgi:hypothetical protein
MSFLDTPRDGAGFLILVLAHAIIIAISPFRVSVRVAAFLPG